MSRDINPFGLRMPGTLKARIEDAAAESGRSLNAEIVDRLTRSFDKAGTSVEGLPDGVLLDAVLARFGARLQIVVAPETAEAHGIGVPAPTRPKKSRS